MPRGRPSRSCRCPRKLPVGMARCRRELVGVPIDQVALQRGEVRVEQLLARRAHHLGAHVQHRLGQALATVGLGAGAAGPQARRLLGRSARPPRPPLRICLRLASPTTDAAVARALPQPLGHRLAAHATGVVAFVALAIVKVAKHHVAPILAFEAKVLLLSHRCKAVVLAPVEVPNVCHVEMLRRQPYAPAASSARSGRSLVAVSGLVCTRGVASASDARGRRAAA
eukprot:CAMPEP_0183355806 /NCGR_PEP_ID=MMETSP0164_2-20130417/41934_1 /TAXON_ID=221442 /ORGANISM="Coccolithus pelagicus ssp braarudi, Strain PLY182g" /LENGTH=225 /DNA_ID=CAMNT_0025529035 /DNA_START=384 /DNA_END=1058 /DNA_ORIENTATION=+